MRALSTTRTRSRSGAGCTEMTKCGWCTGPQGAIPPHCSRGIQTKAKQNAAKTCTCYCATPVAPETTQEPRIKRRKRTVK